MNPQGTEVVVLIGSGAIGQAIVRRVGVGKRSSWPTSTRILCLS
jgi:hypothetical protein